MGIQIGGVWSPFGQFSLEAAEQCAGAFALDNLLPKSGSVWMKPSTKATVTPPRLHVEYTLVNSVLNL